MKTNKERIEMLARMIDMQKHVQDHKRIVQMDLRLLNQVGYKTVKNPENGKLERIQ